MSTYSFYMKMSFGEEAECLENIEATPTNRRKPATDGMFHLIVSFPMVECFSLFKLLKISFSSACSLRQVSCCETFTAETGFECEEGTSSNVSSYLCHCPVSLCSKHSQIHESKDTYCTSL